MMVLCRSGVMVLRIGRFLVLFEVVMLKVLFKGGSCKV